MGPSLSGYPDSASEWALVAAQLSSPNLHGLLAEPTDQPDSVTRTVIALISQARVIIGYNFNQQHRPTCAEPTA
ncbi:hypothetical protein LA080_001589 [Diaporthe eres]|nr:hypothetical protein LA080_001589 [Diaporthe eres]